MDRPVAIYLRGKFNPLLDTPHGDLDSSATSTVPPTPPVRETPHGRLGAGAPSSHLEPPTPRNDRSALEHHFQAARPGDQTEVGQGIALDDDEVRHLSRLDGSD